MTKLMKSFHRKVINENISFNTIKNLPEQFDWREKGFHTPSYNQKDCGSCYAFSIVNVIQAQIFKETNRQILLR